MRCIYSFSGSAAATLCAALFLLRRAEYFESVQSSLLGALALSKAERRFMPHRCRGKGGECGMASKKDNLIPQNKRTKIEQREIAQKGGIASGKARREKADLRKMAQTFLDGTYTVKGEEVTGAEMVWNSIMENAANPYGRNWGKAMEMLAMLSGANMSPEQKASIRAATAKVRTETKLLKEQIECNVNTDVYNGIPATLIAPTFQPVLLDIAESGHTEYDFPGGRGSTKSTFISLEIVDLIMQHPDMNACAMRKVGKTLRDSCYAQIKWAIGALKLESEFIFTVSPMEITRKATGQKIYFRGADDPLKMKSIKPEIGYPAILWFEEMDQFAGESELRSIRQSVIRGGDDAIIFCSFNPPKSANNWANDYVLSPPANRLVTRSDYLSVPKKWLGKAFLDLADELKEKNPEAYKNEYLGEANGSGGNVFDNLDLRPITDEELAQFDNLLNGVDWGWYPDLYAFVRVHYDPARLTLYIWQEYTCNKKSNRETAEQIISLGITAADIVTCDSAEEKSVSDYRSFGINARAAEKGPESRRYSFKWLQSLVKIVIDPDRCPVVAKEFRHFEYERDKDGKILSSFPDGDDHCIDAVRYATNRIWKKRGQ